MIFTKLFVNYIILFSVAGANIFVNTFWRGGERRGRKNPDNRRITRQAPHRKKPGVQAGNGEED